MDTTAERKTKEVIKKTAEMKAKFGAEKTALYIWNRYGYGTSVKDGMVILYGHKIGHGNYVLAKI